jgi:phospholipid/cholesterol/gamma-HCH transport system substrate-binding protein
MKVTNKQKIRLGIFVILSASALIAALYLIGKKQNIFGNTFYISAIFENVNGLKLGNNVRFSGINVGTVRGIKMINDTTICVDMAMEQNILPHIKINSIATIGSDGLVGSMVVNIFPGKGSSPHLQPGDTLGSMKKVSTVDMISTLSVTNQNAAELSKQLLKITTTINEGKGTPGLLVHDEAMGAELKATVSNLKLASEDASKVVNQIQKVITAINDEENLLHVLVKDSVAAHQFKNVISNLEKSSQNIDSVITNLNEVILNVKDGEGALNYLVQDTVLVNDINEIVKNIKTGSVLLNEDLKALQSNTFFKGYFKKQEKQRLKEEKEQSKSKK